MKGYAVSSFYKILKNLFCYLFIIFALTSCATTKLGTILPDGNYPSIAEGDSGRAKITYNEYAQVGFDWEIDHSNKTIEINGRFCNSHPQWDFISGVSTNEIVLSFEVFFMDNYRVVSGVEKITIFFGEGNNTDMKNTTFTKKMPYVDLYKKIYLHPKISGHYFY